MYTLKQPIKQVPAIDPWSEQGDKPDKASFGGKVSFQHVKVGR